MRFFFFHFALRSILVHNLLLPCPLKTPSARVRLMTRSGPVSIPDRVPFTGVIFSPSEHCPMPIYIYNDRIIITTCLLFFFSPTECKERRLTVIYSRGKKPRGRRTPAAVCEPRATTVPEEPDYFYI